MAKLKKVQHGMLLRGKNIMDDALSELERLKDLVPEKLHDEFDKIVASFEDTLCDCDVSGEWIERKEYDNLESQFKEADEEVTQLQKERDER